MASGSAKRRRIRPERAERESQEDVNASEGGAGLWPPHPEGRDRRGRGTVTVLVSGAGRIPSASGLVDPIVAIRAEVRTRRVWS